MARAFDKIINSKVKDVAGEAWDMISGKTILHSNRAINSIPKQFDNFAGAGQYVGVGMKTGNWKGAADEVFRKQDGTLNGAKIAGSFIGASAAARVATGGGLTKDRHGNTNIIGVPFV